jgi:hypothetical protein
MSNVTVRLNQATQPTVQRVTAGGVITLTALTDVDSSQLADGAVLVYNASAAKFETINTLEKQIINGGSY